MKTIRREATGRGPSATADCEQPDRSPQPPPIDAKILAQAFDPDDVGLSNEETARILGIEPETLATWRSLGRGPKFRKTGRRVEYTPRHVREFQQSCVQTPEPATVRRLRRAST
jgi:transposase-like protein